MIELACQTVAVAFEVLGCNGKCNRLHLCQKRCAKLATSLDSWRPLWEAMTYEQLQPYFNYLLEVSIDYMHKHGIEAPAQHYLFFATPMHHLIAALLMLGHDELVEKVRESCGR